MNYLLITVVVCISIAMQSYGVLGSSVNGVTESSWKTVDVNLQPAVNVNNENTAPIIGVLTQEVSKLVLRSYPGRNWHSYIAASYVKFVEGAGGRVVPLWMGQSRDYYKDIMSKINGVLLPGGATFFNETGGYAEAGRHIYEVAMEMNQRGVYMPVWGTCLGYELMIDLAANETELRTNCSSSGQALPLEFKSDFRDSRMYGQASSYIIETLSNFPVTANFHVYCFTEKTFADYNMTDHWRVLTINHDWLGDEFISSVEHKDYPFYGVQFHPEKNIYEFIPNRNITHTAMAIQTSQYFADFFVNETRKNNNTFADKTEEMNTLIYNYQPEYTGRFGSAFLQQYLFERNAAPQLAAHALLCTLALALAILKLHA